MRLGVFQAACGGSDFDERLVRLGAALDGRDLDLVVCPELFATGYHIDGKHGDLAEPAMGRYFDGFADLARRNGTAIAFGYPEADRDQTYNSAAIVGPDGQLLANHRKRLPSPGSFEETSFAHGDGTVQTDIAGMKVAIVICYEFELPESARAAAQAGAELIVVPTALIDAWPVVAEQMVPTRAFENGIWVAYANHGGWEMSYRYFGGSRIVAPDGKIVAKAGQGEELVTARVSSAACRAAQKRLPYLRDCVKL